MKVKVGIPFNMKEKNMKRGRKRKLENEGPNPVDILLGSKVRLRRSLIGMSQEKLAEAIGLTFQQVQKYEKGLNRIGAARLWQISNILQTPISFFYEDINKDNSKSSIAENTTEIEYDLMQRKETVDLIRYYYQIEDPKIAKNVLNLVKSIASSSNDEDKN